MEGGLLAPELAVGRVGATVPGGPQCGVPTLCCVCPQDDNVC